MGDDIHELLAASDKFQKFGERFNKLPRAALDFFKKGEGNAQHVAIPNSEELLRIIVQGVRAHLAGDAAAVEAALKEARLHLRGIYILEGLAAVDGFLNFKKHWREIEYADLIPEYGRVWCPLFFEVQKTVLKAKDDPETLPEDFKERIDRTNIFFVQVESVEDELTRRLKRYRAARVARTTSGIVLIILTAAALPVVIYAEDLRKWCNKHFHFWNDMPAISAPAKPRADSCAPAPEPSASCASQPPADLTQPLQQSKAVLSQEHHRPP